MEDASEEGHPRLKVSNEAFQDFGLSHASREVVANSFDGTAVRIWMRALLPMRGAVLPGGRAPPNTPSPPPACFRGTSAAVELHVAAWNVTGLLVATRSDPERYWGKVCTRRSVVGANDVVALQGALAHAADLAALMKVTPDCVGMGTFADSRNAVCVVVLLRCSFVVEAAEVGRPLRVMVDLPAESLNFVAIRSDVAKAVGWRRSWLRRAPGPGCIGGCRNARSASGRYAGGSSCLQGVPGAARFHPQGRVR